MNEYRPLTSEEYNTLLPLLTRLDVLASNDITRLIDSHLSKEYDVYLFHRQHEKFILKKIKPFSHDKAIYDQYFDDFDSFFQFVQKRFFEAPHSLIHDDLLPINVMLEKENLWIIDWETAGILPYFLDLARFAFVWNEKSGFYISYEAGMTFLDAYYDEMRKNPHFNINKEQFYQDVAVSAFCQYAIFLYFEKDVENIQSTAYFRFFKKILGYLKLDDGCMKEL